jgi:hypothetical protein
MANPLLREGPIPVWIHGVIEYVAGILFIAAPLLFDFDDSTATGVSVAVGILILIVAATTADPTGLVKAMTISVHVVLDFVLAVALIVAPFVLGFSDDTPPTVFFIVLGVAHLLITVGTKFETGTRTGEAAPTEPSTPPAHRPSRTSGRSQS